MRTFFKLIVACFLLTSCSSDINSDSYTMPSVGSASRVEQGVVIDVRTVQIQGDTKGGTTIGGIAGGFAGSTIGHNSTSVLGAVGGALIGALVGGITQKELSEQKALQYIIELKNGSMVTVIQGLKNEIPIGQAVLILYGKETRVIPKNNSI